MKKGLRLLVSLLITLLLAGIGYYIFLPPLNIFAEEFWVLLAALAIVFNVVYWLLGWKEIKKDKSSSAGFKNPFKIGFRSDGKQFRAVRIAAIIVPVAVLIVGSVLSASFFHADAYANIIQVKEAVFEEDMPETDLVTNIALTDSQTASIIGARKLGYLSEVVSQYQVNGTYYQINYNKTPQKVSCLEYADFFRWFNNRKKGIPGYIMVDTVNSSAEYNEFPTAVRYTDSAYFSDDLNRKLRFEYPTKIFGSYSFEVDDSGNPYYIVSCMKPRVGLFGAKDVSEVIIFNPVDGSSALYSLDQVPSWVDNVYTGTLASQKYDWHGTLQNGFWNSIFGKKDCKVTTDDYGYIVLDDDVWFFTGVTSVVSDESNIGFIISNARTGEYKFYSVIGAEEYSAMGSAQGQVQEKGYTASFPALINVSGEATYIMTLKDAESLVRMYALVNVENYRIVAIGDSQTEAKQAYIKKLQSEGVLKPEDIELPTAKTAEITVSDLRFFVVGGESMAYITGSDGFLYKQTVSSDESLVLLQTGERITVEYADGSHEKIRQIISWKRTEQ